jgi:TM2 domain-containing membrane protein YozV
MSFNVILCLSKHQGFIAQAAILMGNMMGIHRNYLGYPISGRSVLGDWFPVRFIILSIYRRFHLHLDYQQVIIAL